MQRKGINEILINFFRDNQIIYLETADSNNYCKHSIQIINSEQIIIKYDHCNTKKSLKVFILIIFLKGKDDCTNWKETD